MGVGGQSHAPATLPPGKTRYPLYRRLGRPQCRSGRVPNISAPPGFDPQTVQLVASRYTDYAIPVFYEHSLKIKKNLFPAKVRNLDSFFAVWPTVRWDRATMRSTSPPRGRLLCRQLADITHHSLYWRVAYERQQRANSRDIIGTPPSRHNREGEHGIPRRFPLPAAALPYSLRKDSKVYKPQQPLHFPTHWGRRDRFTRRSNLAFSRNSSKQVANKLQTIYSYWDSVYLTKEILINAGGFKTTTGPFGLRPALLIIINKQGFTTANTSLIL